MTFSPRVRDAYSNLTCLSGGLTFRAPICILIVTAVLTWLTPADAQVNAQAPVVVASWPTTMLPLGLALDGHGRIFMADEIGDAMRVFDLAGNLQFVVDPGGGFEGYGVGFLSDGTVLVADYYGRRLFRYRSDGFPLGSWATGGSLAIFIAVDPADNVFVTDGDGDAVRKFSSGGGLLAQWTSPHPSGVAYAGGRVYVAGMFDGLVHVFTPDGTPIETFPTGCTWAEQLTPDPTGQFLFLTDHTKHQLKCFGVNGSLQWTLGPNLGSPEFSDVDFFSVAVTPDGTIFAGDYTNRRVLELAPQATPTTRVSWGALKERYK